MTAFNHPSHQPHRHASLALALAIALLPTPALHAADFNQPLRFSGSPSTMARLLNARVTVVSSQNALSLQGVNFTLGTVLISNRGAGGGLAVQNSTTLQGGDLDVAIFGSGVSALSVSGQSSASLSTATLETRGGRSPVVTLSDAALRMSDSTLQSGGILSPGIKLGRAASLLLQRSQVQTTGMTSAALDMQDDAQDVTLLDSQLHTLQAESHGVSVGGSSGLLTLRHSSVLTEAGSSDGVYLTDSSHAQLSQNSSVHTLGQLAAAVQVMRNSQLILDHTQLLTEGERSASALAASTSTITLLDSQALSTGMQSPVLEIQGQARINAVRSQLGNVDHSAVRFVVGSSSGSGELALIDSTLTGQGTLIDAQDNSRAVANISGSQLTSSNGPAFAASTDSQFGVSMANSHVTTAQLASVTANGHLDLMASDSLLWGDTRLAAPPLGQVNLDLRDSDWLFGGQAEVSRLKLANASVSFAGSGYQVLTVYGDLTGNGRFRMKTDLSTSQGDLLAVQGQVQGRHELLVADSGRDANGNALRLVDSGGGAGQFNLAGGHVDAGAWRYTLQQQGSDWYLVPAGSLVPMISLTPAIKPQTIPQPQPSVAMTALTPAMQPQAIPQPKPGIAMTALTPAMQPQATPQPKPSVAMTALTPALQPQAIPPSVNMPANQPVPTPHLRQPARLSKGADVALGMQSAAAALWQAELGTLNQRLGELRLGHDRGGLWARGTADTVKIDSHYSRAFEQHIHGFQVGADGALEQRNGTLYLGGLAGTSRSQQHFAEQVSGQIDSQTVGLYATYLRDNGWYLDGVLKYDHLRGEVNVPGNTGGRARGRYTADAYGASLEAGRQLALGDGWFVEPQVQLSATHMQAPNYRSDDGLKVAGDASDSLQGRVGARWGRNLVLDSGQQLQGYLSASHVEEFAGDTAMQVNGHHLNNELPGSHNEFGAGGSLQLSARQKLSLQADYAHGPHLEHPVVITLGYRYLW